MHLPTLRKKRALEARAERAVRDATEAEICQEPDVVLEALVSGQMFATWMTRQYAITELDRRRHPRPKPVPFDQEVAEVRPPAALLAVLPQLHLIDPDVEAPAALRRAKAAYDERTAS